MDDTTSHFIYEEINFRERKYPVFASIAVLTIPVLLLWMGVISVVVSILHRHSAFSWVVK